jgi:hypothetical protein
MTMKSMMVGAAVAAAALPVNGAAHADPVRGETVVFHIESYRAVDLAHLSSDGRWGQVCSSPCDAAFVPDGLYRIEADGAPLTGTFALHGDPGGRTTLRVSRSGGAHGAGVAATAIGAIGLAIGLVGIDVEETFCFSIFGPCTPSPDGAAVAAFAGAAVVGVVLLAAGIVTLATSGPSVSQVEAPPPVVVVAPRPEVPAAHSALAWTLRF